MPTPTYRDAPAYRKCSTCDRKVLPPRKKCNVCRVSKKYTVTTMNPSRKGMNSIGAAHKPDRSRVKRKGQNSSSIPTPMTAVNMRGWV